MIVSRLPFGILEKSICSVDCTLLHRRSFATFCNRLGDARAKTEALETRETIPHSVVLQEAPKAYGKDVSEFTPKPLDRPIGLCFPPQAGDNSGIDTRTWKQRRDDFVDYEKHIVRRRLLTAKMATPYFREWKNMRFAKGKSFLAPPRLFRADKALYFPNLFGRTLLRDGRLHDTTPILQNKISILSVYSSAWGENQAASFISKEKNPQLHEVVSRSGNMAQIVQINFEDNALKALLIRLFLGAQRKKFKQEDWGKYFIVQKGLSMELRDMIGLLNKKVGYTYLLDRECKIRWAGSGFCEDSEREGLVKGVKKLLEDANNPNNTVTKMSESDSKV